MDKIKELGTRIIEDRRTVKILAVIIVVVTAFLFFGPKGKNENVTLENKKDEISSGKASGTASGTANDGGNGEVAEESDKEKETQGGGKIFIDIAGEVKNPGVYEVTSDSRIFEAIEKAGGLTEKADTTNVNQAETVKDGQKISIPKKGATAQSSGGSGGEPSQTTSAPASKTQTSAGTDPASGAKININSADSSQLQSINGIGPSTAEKIIRYRTSKGAFKSIDDLKKVNGIGDKKLEKLRPYVTI